MILEFLVKQLNSRQFFESWYPSFVDSQNIALKLPKLFWNVVLIPFQTYFKLHLNPEEYEFEVYVEFV